MTDRYKESIQGARDCVERNKDGGVYLPDLLVVIDSQQAQIDTMLEDLQFRTNQVIEQQAEIEEMHKRVMRLDSEREEWSRSATTEQLKNIELQAEIERLEKELSTATNHITRLENQIERLLPMLKTKRAEAIKEFAERLKGIYINDKRYDRPNAHTLIDWLFKNIDNLVKEMAGDDK